MFRIKILISIIIFSSLLIFTSVIKNQTRDIEKKIFYLSQVNNLKNKDLNESQLDFFYLTSPLMIEKRVKEVNFFEYVPMDHSKIFLDLSSFTDLKQKFVNKDNHNEKKNQNK